MRLLLSHDLAVSLQHASEMRPVLATLLKLPDQPVFPTWVSVEVEEGDIENITGILAGLERHGCERPYIGPFTARELKERWIASSESLV